MRAICAVLLLLASSLSSSAVRAQTAKTLEIYVIDVEGGEATLFVSPSGESMLVDTGWPGFGGRDAERIAAAAKQAGIKQIDYLVITHFHGDHMGGVAQLAARLPIRHFIDHGSTVDQGAQAEASFKTYADIRRKSAYTEAKPGDKIPVAGLNVQIIAANGQTLDAPLAGAGAPNPLCAGFKPHGQDITGRSGDAEDRRSVSTFMTYGNFRTIILGDLTWNQEQALMCPNNKLGAVDLYLVSHHGADTSGSQAFVYPLRPRVAVMNNGARKGGAVQTFQILKGSQGLEDLWQSHYSIAGGSEYNPPERFIANLEDAVAAPPAPPPTHLGAANWIKISARSDGSFVVTNSRNGYTKSYKAVK